MSSLPYVPLDRRGWHLAMGLRPLDESKWFEVDARRDSELVLKKKLVNEERDVVVAIRETGAAPSAELLGLVVENLATYHPGVPLDIVEGEHPIVQASLLVQEDLCVLVHDEKWRLEAACVCFPSRWNLLSKLGATLDDIHAPLPGYDQELSRPTNAFFDRLKPERSFWRLNWTLLDDADLHQPSGRREGLESDPDQWFFRIERQTVRKLPETRAAVFSIRTYVASLEQMMNESADFVENLLLALDSAPVATKAYKGWVGVAQQLRAALA